MERRHLHKNLSASMPATIVFRASSAKHRTDLSEGEMQGEKFWIYLIKEIYPPEQVLQLVALHVAQLDLLVEY